MNEEIKKEKNKLIPILIILIVLLVGVLVWVLVFRETPEEKPNNNNINENNPNNNDNNNNEEKKLEKGTFVMPEAYGKFQVEGYVTVVELPDCPEFCEEGEEYNTLNYAIFNITKIENTEFPKFLEQMDGNSFVGDYSIGLGCSTDGILNYYNDSNATGMKKYELTKADSDVILKSTKEKPIILELERFLFTGGSGAPSCYSHISTINIID